ncbi:hypothetical protein [Streptomyces sp. NPDC041003]|uniref:hypothetical protein n=1 Tax=Streptomyces sp. NPDC041003 TaxID=3155730 RepID=UPI00340D23C6
MSLLTEGEYGAETEAGYRAEGAYGAEALHEAEVDARVSPFASLSMFPVAAPGTEAEQPETTPVLESPFGAGLVSESRDRGDEAAAEFLDGLTDEDFAEAVERLVDEAAAQHLTEPETWSATPSEAEALAGLESWIEPLAAETERAIDGFAEGLAGLDLLGMAESDLAEFLESASEAPQLGSEGFDQFVGGILRKAKSMVRGVVRLARKGIKAVGSVLPIGAVLSKLKALVRPLLRRVLRAATNRLPVSVRPIARRLAARLGLGEAEAEALEAAGGDPVARLAEDFDAEVAALLFAPEALTEAEEARQDEAEEGREAPDRLRELDAARARLGGQLTEMPAGTRPVPQIEQFVPAVLAVRPLIKLGISLIGREKVVRFIADRIAGLIQGLVGAQAARTISRPIVDVGLRALGFEVPEAEEEALAGEALASTVESTVLRMLELPAETFEDELQLDAAVQQAFAEAAAAYMPDRLLRADLPERETAGEGGVWVLMPRTTRPRHRFRRFTRVYMVPVSRQTARTVPWSDGGTLEAHLLDRGADRWPVQMEVHLYEAVPGTQFGHLTQDESLPAGERPDSAEYQPLTPEIAGLLLGEPGLGRRIPAGALWRGRGRPVPGRRYFRLRPIGLPARRTRPPRRKRVLIRFDPAAGRLGIAVRLTERQAQQLLSRLEATAPGGRPDLPTVLGLLRGVYATALPTALAGRLLKRSLAADGATAARIADRVTAAVSSALSAFLIRRTAQFAAAVRDPADGATLTFTFSGVTRETLDSSLPRAQVAVTPGWHRHA